MSDIYGIIWVQPEQNREDNNKQPPLLVKTEREPEDEKIQESLQKDIKSLVPWTYLKMWVCKPSQKCSQNDKNQKERVIWPVDIIILYDQHIIFMDLQTKRIYTRWFFLRSVKAAVFSFMKVGLFSEFHHCYLCLGMSWRSACPYSRSWRFCWRLGVIFLTAWGCQGLWWFWFGLSWGLTPQGWSVHQDQKFIVFRCSLASGSWVTCIYPNFISFLAYFLSKLRITTWSVATILLLYECCCMPGAAI